jgi:hypothetical protein
MLACDRAFQQRIAVFCYCLRLCVPRPPCSIDRICRLSGAAADDVREGDDTRSGSSPASPLVVVSGLAPRQGSLTHNAFLSQRSRGSVISNPLLREESLLIFLAAAGLRRRVLQYEWYQALTRSPGVVAEPR